MADDKQFVQPAIPRFDGYYHHWAMLMENLLRSKEYWNLVEIRIPSLPTAPMPEQMKTVEDARLKDLKLKNYPFQA
ncbi:retrovirus-related Pol polyprotein from transposon TNT 1-94, partial [Trifolium medium]|nr:retrovirus-related Pol polyprotein from transposon TNT 1-94 [Trifolium medium]